MITGLNRCWSQHEHFSKIILVRFFSSLDPFFLFCSSTCLCLFSPPVFILCSSPYLLKSYSRVSSRILCLPNLISKEHSLLLFKNGKFLQNLYRSYFCLLLHSFHNHAFNKKTPKLTSLFTLPIQKVSVSYTSDIYSIWCDNAHASLGTVESSTKERS